MTKSEQIQRISIAEADVKNIELPDGYEIVKKPDPWERVLEEIARLEAELVQMQPPTDEELIEVGRMHHEYYFLMEQREINNKILLSYADNIQHRD